MKNDPETERRKDENTQKYASKGMHIYIVWICPLNEKLKEEKRKHSERHI